MAWGVLKIKAQVKSWCNISSSRGQIKPNEKKTTSLYTVLLEWQLHASTLSPSVCKAMDERSLTGLHHRRVEDMQVSFSHLTKPFLFLRAQRKRELWTDSQIQKKDNDICNVTTRLSGDKLFLIKGPIVISTSLCLFICSGPCRNLQNCWHTESSCSCPAAILCRSSLIDPIRQVHRVMLAAC